MKAMCISRRGRPHGSGGQKIAGRNRQAVDGRLGSHRARLMQTDKERMAHGFPHRKKNSARPLWQPQRGLVSVIIPRTTGSALAPHIGHLSDYAMLMPKIDRTRMMAV